jgi:tetratricopeptide (TPR) repeat protein
VRLKTPNITIAYSAVLFLLTNLFFFTIPSKTIQCIEVKSETQKGENIPAEENMVSMTRLFTLTSRVSRDIETSHNNSEMVIVAEGGEKDINTTPEEKTRALSLLKKGIQEYRAENFEEALELFKEARKTLPDSSIVAYYMGLTYKLTGKYKEAAKNFRDALTLKPTVNDAYTELIDALYNLNELEEAKKWLEKAEKEKIKPAQIAFLKGLIFSKEGKNIDAIDAFERSKELDSSLTQAADFQIALAYSKERRYEKARKSLQAVISVDPLSELSAFAREYEKAFRAVERYKAWSFSVGAQFQYDENVVLKPSPYISSLEITDEMDINMSGSFSAKYRPLITGNAGFNAQYSINVNNYSHTKTHNQLSQSLSLSPSYRFKKGTISFPLSYYHTLLQGRGYMSQISLKPSLSIILKDGDIAQITVGFSKKEMLKQPLNTEEDTDADIYSASGAYIHPFYEGKGMVNIKYEFTRNQSDGRNWENHSNKVSLTLLLPLAGDMSMSLSGDADYTDYKYSHATYGIRRLDRTFSGSSTLTKNITDNTDLTFQYSYTRADSNIAVYDYVRNMITLGIDYNF